MEIIKQQRDRVRTWLLLIVVAVVAMGRLHEMGKIST